MVGLGGKRGRGSKQNTYLVSSRPNECIVAQVSAYICGDDLPIDAIPGYEVLVLPGGAWRCRRRGVVSIPAGRHCVCA